MAKEAYINNHEDTITCKHHAKEQHTAPSWDIHNQFAISI